MLLNAVKRCGLVTINLRQQIAKVLVLSRFILIILLRQMGVATQVGARNVAGDGGYLLAEAGGVL